MKALASPTPTVGAVTKAADAARLEARCATWDRTA